ncbi:MAG: hypothetical protein GY751_05830, partial [Bacteroidetes bacterium]|nr:hypothetical protein [Bacteroidota bacterium]
MSKAKFLKLTTLDIESTPINQGFIINILGNDTDPDPIQALTASIEPGNLAPSNGSINLLPNGLVEYFPDPDFIGTDQFEYTVCDNGCGPLCDVALVTINVINQLPIAIDDYEQTPLNTPVDVDVL